VATLPTGTTFGSGGSSGATRAILILRRRNAAVRRRLLVRQQHDHLNQERNDRLQGRTDRLFLSEQSLRASNGLIYVDPADYHPEDLNTWTGF
jgi:hypothetical protein